MCAPLPLKHADAEPWLAFLREHKATRSANVRPTGLLIQAPEPRELLGAAIETAFARVNIVPPAKMSHF